VEARTRSFRGEEKKLLRKEEALHCYEGGEFSTGWGVRESNNQRHNRQGVRGTISRGNKSGGVHISQLGGLRSLEQQEDDQHQDPRYLEQIRPLERRKRQSSEEERAETRKKGAEYDYQSQQEGQLDGKQNRRCLEDEGRVSSDCISDGTPWWSRAKANQVVNREKKRSEQRSK
jgi:hypothetical protein